MKKGMTVKDPNKITKIDRDIEVTIRKISRLKLSKLTFEFRDGEIIDNGSVGENTNVKNKSPKIYDAACSQRLLDRSCSHMRGIRKKNFWTKEECIK